MGVKINLFIFECSEYFLASNQLPKHTFDVFLDLSKNIDFSLSNLGFRDVPMIFNGFWLFYNMETYSNYQLIGAQMHL